MQQEGDGGRGKFATRGSDAGYAQEHPPPSALERAAGVPAPRGAGAALRVPPRCSPPPRTERGFALPPSPGARAAQAPHAQPGEPPGPLQMCGLSPLRSCAPRREGGRAGSPRRSAVPALRRREAAGGVGSAPKLPSASSFSSASPRTAQVPRRRRSGSSRAYLRSGAGRGGAGGGAGGPGAVRGAERALRCGGAAADGARRAPLKSRRQRRSRGGGAGRHGGRGRGGARRGAAARGSSRRRHGPAAQGVSGADVAPQPRTGGPRFKTVSLACSWRGREAMVPLVAVPGARWLCFITQFIPQCPVLGWAGDPRPLVLGPRSRTGREFHETQIKI